MASVCALNLFKFSKLIDKTGEYMQPRKVHVIIKYSRCYGNASEIARIVYKRRK